VWACKGSDSSKERLGDQARKNLPEPETLCTRLTPTGSGTAQKIGCPVYLNPHLGRHGDQVRPSPHSTDSENLLKHHPPQRQEHFETDEKAKESPFDLDEPTFSTCISMAPLPSVVPREVCADLS
jgi:hypothetical protein